MQDASKHLLQALHKGLHGDVAGLRTLARRIARECAQEEPDLAERIEKLISGMRSSPRGLRDVAVPPPVEPDTRSSLLFVEAIGGDEARPVLPDRQSRLLDQIVMEWAATEALEREGLRPTRSVLLTGPPGTGKTMTARWLAGQLRRPLMTLSLGSLMSSLLGRSGANLRNAIEFARGQDGVLFVDEIDALAKSRAESDDVGEQKRLVAVFLQELDRWPEDRLLLAATNHPELLDSALWRRFDETIAFPEASEVANRNVVGRLLGRRVEPSIAERLLRRSAGLSPADLETLVSSALRRSIVFGTDLNDELDRRSNYQVPDDEMRKPERVAEAIRLVRSGVSQREAARRTGVARNTIAKHMKDDERGSIS